MNKLSWFPLLLVGYMILSNKLRISEGFENDDNKDDDNKDDDNKDDDNKDDDNKDDDNKDDNKDDNCEYRKKQKGRMCNEKWGEPPCNSWKKTKNINDIKTSKPCSSSTLNESGKCIKEESHVLKGYYPNNFMYEIDYEEYSTELVESEGVDNDNNDIPRGVHSSFFS
jgi:hypothetical protein